MSFRVVRAVFVEADERAFFSDERVPVVCDDADAADVAVALALDWLSDEEVREVFVDDAFVVEDFFTRVEVTWHHHG